MAENYWLTVHYPPFLNGGDKEWLLDVFEKSRESKVRVGDMVFIYETQKHPSVREGERIIPRMLGAKRIIALVKIVSPAVRSGGPEILVEEDRIHDWQWQAGTQLMEFCDFSLDELRHVLGNPRWTGYIKGGLQQLSHQQYDNILRSSRTPTSPDELRRCERRYLPNQG